MFKKAGILLLVWAVTLAFFSWTVRSGRAEEGDVWVTTGEWSHHTNEDAHHYRQNNTGIGVQYDWSRDSSIGIGYYDNSIHRETAYFGMTYTPLHLGDVNLGVVGAVVTGYTQHIPAVPMGTFFGSYAYRDMGVNVYWLPSVVAAVQLKWKIE